NGGFAAHSSLQRDDYIGQITARINHIKLGHHWCRVELAAKGVALDKSVLLLGRRRAFEGDFAGNIGGKGGWRNQSQRHGSKIRKMLIHSFILIVYQTELLKPNIHKMCCKGFVKLFTNSSSVYCLK